MNRRPRGFDPTKPEPLPEGFKVPGWLVLRDRNVQGFDPENVWSWHLDCPAQLEPYIYGCPNHGVVSCDQLLRQLLAQGLKEDAIRMIAFVKQLASERWQQLPTNLEP